MDIAIQPRQANVTVHHVWRKDQRLRYSADAFMSHADLVSLQAHGEWQRLRKDERAQVEMFPAKMYSTVSDAHDVEQIIDEPGQIRDLTIDDLLRAPGAVALVGRLL